MTSTEEHNPHRAHLLVVDDMEVNRTLMSRQLRKRGYNISTASSGPEAIEKIDSNEIDLILLDIRMPDMDGIEVLSHIRKTYSALTLPVIMVTAENLNEVIVEALQIGANDYLVKPINVPVAVARIEAQLGLAHMATIKDDIVRFASHDLKKPLLTMLDIAQTLRDELESSNATPADQEELLELLLRTGHNMQGVISGFLDQEALRQTSEERIYHPLDINQIVLSSIENNASYAQHKEITLSSQLAASIPMVPANEFRLTQILDNLIGNALKYCPKGSTVKIVSHIEDNEIFVEIIDNGPGLQEDDFPKLFTKHAKLSNKPTGGENSSGVGLSLCKQLITLDNGNIGARNNPDAGTTFWISLPSEITL